MTKPRFRLASNKAKKLTCPKCESRNHWQRYINIETGEVLPDCYGRCDNEDKCGTHNLPPKEILSYFVPVDSIADYSEKAYKVTQGNTTSYLPKSTVYEQTPIGLRVAEFVLRDTKLSFDANDKEYYSVEGIRVVRTVSQPLPPPPIRYIPSSVLKDTMQPDYYLSNTFIQYLLSGVKFPFTVADVERVVSMYYLGTINEGYRAGAVTFPFIDYNNNFRAMQVKQFDEHNHTIATDKIDKVLKNEYQRKGKQPPGWLTDYIKSGDHHGYYTCLFGEHLLNRYPKNPVVLVEAPKTAIYGTLYFGLPENPDTPIWLAVYNKSSFTFDRVKVLKGRRVVVYPDLSDQGKTFNEWNGKAKQFEQRIPGTRFAVSELIEKYASEDDRQAGNDIADILIRYDWRSFRKGISSTNAIPKTTNVGRGNYTEIADATPALKKQAVSAEDVNDQVIVRKLKAIAENTIEPNAHYHVTELFELVAFQTKVDVRRARKGVGKMIKRSVILPVGASWSKGRYYLSDSYPF